MSYDDKSGGAGSGKQSDAHTGDELWNGRSDASGNNKSKHASVPSFKPAELNAFKGTPFELIPLHGHKDMDEDGRSLGKVPKRGWPTCKPMDLEDAKDHLNSGANVGVRLSPADLVIDVDPRNFEADDDPLERLAKDIGMNLADFPKVVTGSGGYHFYTPNLFRQIVKYSVVFLI